MVKWCSKWTEKTGEKGVSNRVTFVILPNLNYSIRNRFGKRAELTFSIIADMPCLAAVIEAGQQAISSEDSQDFQ